MNGSLRQRVKQPLLVILLIYLGLTVGYGIANPLFESPDEQHHYFNAQTVAETWELPTANEPLDEWVRQEAAQPPLYYLLSAVLISPIDTSQAKEQVLFNPFVRLGDAASPTNINAFVHTGIERWPWQGYALAAHLLRLFSAVIGLGTLLFIYGSARLVWPEKKERALLAAALAAFLPQFDFLHASISNDPLVIFFCAAALWQLLRLWYKGVSNRRLVLL
ncbi:MAG: glycosyltransferase family 39 protein, partial [Candidatus Promineifilaceae bacterium]